MEAKLALAVEGRLGQGVSAQVIGGILYAWLELLVRWIL